MKFFVHLGPEGAAPGRVAVEFSEPEFDALLRIVGACRVDTGDSAFAAEFLATVGEELGLGPW